MGKVTNIIEVEIDEKGNENRDKGSPVGAGRIDLVAVLVDTTQPSPVVGVTRQFSRVSAWVEVAPSHRRVSWCEMERVWGVGEDGQVRQEVFGDVGGEIK